MAVEHGMIGFLTCNSSLLTAPYGGVDRVFGTNPFAFAFPRSGTPFLMDFAASVVAEGKLRVAMAKGVPSPKGGSWTRSASPPPTRPISMMAASSSRWAATRVMAC